ncbi:MAG: insulinase family protein, partial [Acidobacteria bacterium]|nr:insulinase family protein [Acidobacteriota bacterium]
MKTRTSSIRRLGSRLQVGLLALILGSILSPSLSAEPKAEVPVQVFQLANGMEFLTVSRPEIASVYAGWVAHVGSANERPGITGISHFFEHMMFKGTSAIGTTDAERDRAIMVEQEEIQEELRAAYRKQRERYRLGDIDDPFSDANRTPEMVELEERFEKLVEEQRRLMVKDEFDQVYTKNGASGMNAFTTHDLTGYVINLPSNKLELWFWMES